MEIIDISKINKIRKNKGITIKQLVENCPVLATLPYQKFVPAMSLNQIQKH